MATSSEARAAFAETAGLTRTQMVDSLADRAKKKSEFLAENDPSYVFLIAQDLVGAKMPEAYYGADLTGKPIEGELWDGGARTQLFLYGVADCAGAAGLIGGAASKIPGVKILATPVPGLGTLDKLNPSVPGLGFLDKPIKPPIFAPKAALTAGQIRVSKYGSLWQKASLDKAIARHAGPNASSFRTATGKTIYENPATGRQVVVDDAGYFRIFQPKSIGSQQGVYLDMLVPQHGNGVSRSRDFAYTSQALDYEAKEVTNARDGGKGQGEREAVGGFGGTQSVAHCGEGDCAACVDLGAGFSGALERADCGGSRAEPAAGRRVAATLARRLGVAVRLGMHRAAPAP
jgi:hypothetical protein